MIWPGYLQSGPLVIKVKKLTPTAIIPTKSYPGDLGWDLYADTNGPRFRPVPWVIEPGQSTVIQTGIAFEFPKGWGAFNRPRSSQGKANIDIYGGVMDSGYRGEICITVHNSNKLPVQYNYGERVGQIVLIPCPESVLEIVEELSESERGEKRFGSSGK